ncbi:ABC transporter ATP-binding protein, partial [Rhizobium sp.]|uniref:ABC transporter ATP-binding protein n=1 Tax=Rhizobium sp. TaxID=391 RepID=UPI000E884581|nr:Fe3+/spermidine/putrescine ABC transporter ATP-binding protein [Rhizobium sp.]
MDSSVSARTPKTTPLLLSARGLVKNYGRSRAVDGVDLDIPERAFTTFLGPSGCGKTTMLRMIAGFEKPDAGSIILDGKPLLDVPPERRPVNTVFQSYALFPHLTVFENVAFSLTLRRRSPDPGPRVKRALETVHMADFADRYPHQLSGGQQQRVA